MRQSSSGCLRHAERRVARPTSSTANSFAWNAFALADAASASACTFPARTAGGGRRAPPGGERPWQTSYTKRRRWSSSASSSRRRWSTRRSSTSAFTEYYLVNLLAGCVRGDALPAPEPGYDETPLALLYVRARRPRATSARGCCAALGDTALFMSGFFADSLSGRLGRRSLLPGAGRPGLQPPEPRGGRRSSWTGSVFSELAARFTQFADVLSEVSETSRLAATRSVLALYERWVQTGSRRAAALLAEQGIVPVAAGRRAAAVSEPVTAAVLRRRPAAAGGASTR